MSSEPAPKVISYESGLEPRDQPLREQVGVARPARRDVAAILDDERVAVIVAGAAARQLARAALEVLGARQRGDDLVLDVGRIGPVVAAAAPERREVRAALHVLGQARRAQPVEHGAALAGGRLTARGDQHTVTDRSDRPGTGKELGGDPVDLP